MELLKKYRLVITVVFIILVLVVIRSTGAKHFKNDATRWAEPSFTQSNIITPEQVKSLKGIILTISLDKKMVNGEEITGDLRNIPADSLLSRKYLNTIMKHDGPVLLFSSETAESARVWMILSQLGRKNIFILSDDSDNEVSKYKFRPDSLLP